MKLRFIFLALGCFGTTSLSCQIPFDVDAINQLVNTIDSMYDSRSLLHSRDSVFHKQNGTFTDYYVDSSCRFKLVVQAVKFNDSNYVLESFYYDYSRPIYATRFSITRKEASPECKFYFIGNKLSELVSKELIDSDDSILIRATNLSKKIGAICY